jgi:predicted AAA+ superfamily ATPase
MRSQGLSASRNTLHLMLGDLEDCFLVRPLQVDADSERRRMVNPRKAYPIDPGLITIYDPTGRTNLGHALLGMCL